MNWDAGKALEKRTKNGALEYRMRWLVSAPWKIRSEPLKHLENVVSKTEEFERDWEHHSVAAKVSKKKGQRK